MSDFIKKNIYLIILFIITLSIGFLTFLTFIDKGFIELNDQNLQYLLILNIILLISLFLFIFSEIQKAIKNDIDNNLIDKDIWKKASKKTKNDAEIKSHYISLKLTEMLLEEEKRLTKKLQRIRTEQYIELEKERARWRILKSLD